RELLLELLVGGHLVKPEQLDRHRDAVPFPGRPVHLGAGTVAMEPEVAVAGDARDGQVCRVRGVTRAGTRHLPPPPDVASRHCAGMPPGRVFRDEREWPRAWV